MHILRITICLASAYFTLGSRKRSFRSHAFEANEIPLLHDGSKLLYPTLESKNLDVARTLSPLVALMLAIVPTPTLNHMQTRGRLRPRVRFLPRMSACPFGQLPDCPLTGSSSNENAKKESRPPSIIDSASQFLDQAESQLMQSAGVTQPFAATAIETAIEGLLRATCEEIGSLTVSISANSSAGLLLRGQVVAGRVEASNIAAYGLRTSQIEFTSDGLDIDIGSPLDARPPNLRAPTRINFKVRWTQDDINRSPLLFGAFQEILRELIQTGVSAAIQERLPEGRLKIQLVSVEALSEGRITLVADAETTQKDGSILRLDGLKVRTRPRASSNMLVLDLPELISTFNGFGAKLEFGVPFLRGAGVPLPSGITLTSVIIEDGVAIGAGHIDVEPLDYDLAFAQLQDLAASAAATSEQGGSSTASAVPVDREDAIDVEASPEIDELQSLPPSRSRS